MTNRPLPLIVLADVIGVIVNMRGFQSRTLTPDEARAVAARLVEAAEIVEHHRTGPASEAREAAA